VKHWLIGLIFIATPIAAQDIHHHDGMSPDVDRFYSTWERPDLPGSSCCSRTDCAPATTRLVNGRWMARRDRDTDWYYVPPEKIETRRDSPDGRSHLCASWVPSGPVFCLVLGSGS
jgi:hypothetical protein